MFQWASKTFDSISQTVAPPPTDGPGRFCYLVQRGEEDAAMGCLAEFDPVNTCVNPAKGLYPIHLACQYALERLIRFLLNQPGINLDHADMSGNTSLHHACMSSNAAATLAVVQMLVNQCGANVLAKNNAGQMPYDVATLNNVRQFLLPIQLQKETQIALDNGGQGLPPGIDLGGLRIKNPNMAPPPMSFGSSQRTQSTTGAPTTPAAYSRVASAPATAPAAEGGYATVGGSSAAIFSKKYSKYGADGFHSSSSDVSLQQKYGHSAAGAHQVVAPPPSSGNAGIAAAAAASNTPVGVGGGDASNPFSRGSALPKQRYVAVGPHGTTNASPQPMMSPYQGQQQMAANVNTFTPGMQQQQQPATPQQPTFNPPASPAAVNTPNTPSTPYMPPPPYQSHNYESATTPQPGFVSPAAATYGGSPQPVISPAASTPAQASNVFSSPPSGGGAIGGFAAQPSEGGVEPAPTAASTAPTSGVGSEIFSAPPSGGVSTEPAEASTTTERAASDVFSAPPSGGVPSTESAATTTEPAAERAASDVFAAPPSGGVPATTPEESAQETKQEDEPAQQTTESAAPIGASEETKDATTNDDWVETADPSSGQTYFYNKATGETSWEKPGQGNAQSEATLKEDAGGWVETQDPTSGTTYYYNSLTGETCWEKPASSSSSTAAQSESNDAPAKTDGDWTEVIDPSTGQTYYFNQKTQETSWENPNQAVKDPSSSSAATSDWVETVDPASGQTYYYNTKTQETSWEKPARVTVENAEAEQPQASESSSQPSSDWVETVDPTSGQTYYYNQVTQETSWEQPTGAQAAEKKEALATSEPEKEEAAETAQPATPVKEENLAAEQDFGAPATTTQEQPAASPFENKDATAASASDVFAAPPSGGVPGGLAAVFEATTEPAVEPVKEEEPTTGPGSVEQVFGNAAVEPSTGAPPAAGGDSAEKVLGNTPAADSSTSAEVVSAEQIFGSTTAEQPVEFTPEKKDAIDDLDGADVGEMHDVTLDTPDNPKQVASLPAEATTEPEPPADLFAAIGMPPPPFKSKR